MWQRILHVILGLLISVNAMAQLAAQKDTADGVTVAVTPRTLGADAKVWEFAVVFDTHSQDLSDDIARSALLLDERGKEFEPLAWEGAGPGGHHREGVLKFNAIAPRPRAVELRITRPGEAKPRSFRWQLE